MSGKVTTENVDGGARIVKRLTNIVEGKQLHARQSARHEYEE